MSDETKTEHRLTRLETLNTAMMDDIKEIKRDLKPITKHVLNLNLMVKLSTSALAVFVIKKLMGY